MMACALKYVLGLMVMWSSMSQLAQSSPSVTVSEGRLRGSWVMTRGGRRIAAFKGIPYAAPPVHELRFQSPQAVKPWPGVKYAREDGNKCVQYNYFLGIHGEEDCLYLNVYTPQINNSSLLPVLFFIHGGAFKSGSGESFIYGPKYLLDEDIVVVTINYRLGLFGFLSLEDAVLPGNLGLKDQRAALRWVHDNIHQFGGDPRAVTLFGESAGAASVHYHMLFNADQGLFRAGICHSGAAMMGGGLQRAGEQRPLVRHLVSEAACPSLDTSSDNLLQCLRTVRPYRLLRMALSFYPAFESLMRNVEISPVVEPSCVEDAFITSDPWNRTTSLPLIIGTNKYEGLFTIADLLKDRTDQNFEEYNRNWETIIPYNLMFNTSAEDPTSVANSLKHFYLKSNDFDREHVLQLVDLLSDGLFNYPVSIAVKNNKEKTYLYSFEYHGKKSILNLLGVDNTFGPTHVDELFLFFPFSLVQAQRISNKTEEEKLMSRKLIKIWANFATLMEPVGEGVDWSPVSSSDLEHLVITGPDDLTMASHFYQDRMAFWHQLPFRNAPLRGIPDCMTKPTLTTN